MKKYWSLYKNHLATALEYRSDIIFLLIYESIGLVGIILYWSAVYRENSNIGGLNLGAMLAYYLIIPLLFMIVDVKLSTNIGEDVRNGTLANYLLKPLRVFMYYVTKLLAQKTVNYALLAPFYALPFVILAGMGLFRPTAGSILLGVLVMVFSLILYTALDFFIGHTSFWLDDVWAYTHVKNIIVGAFGGLYFPLSIVQSPQLLNLINLLPFKYIFYTPMSYLLGKSGLKELASDIPAMIAWSAVFVILATLLWKRGLKKYEAYGR